MRRVPSVLSFLAVGLALALATSVLAAVEPVFDGLSGNGEPAFARLLTDNVEAWYTRWWMIDHATATIDTTYFIVNDDVFGRSLLGLLIKKAKEGVAIRFMVDARGTPSLSRQFMKQDLLQELVAFPNVQIKVFNPVHKAILSALGGDIRQVMASNHDKLLIVDGEWFITGGRNIAFHYFADPEDEPSVFRDTDVLLRGRAVAEQARAAFEVEFNQLRTYEVPPDRFGNWTSEASNLELARRLMQHHLMGLPPVDPARTSFPEAVQALNDELAPYKKMRAYAGYEPFRGERPYPVKLVDKTALFGKQNEITAALVALVDAAQEEVLIENPYVVMTDVARAALKRASDRGVKITIVTNSPDSSDSLLTQAIFVKEWKDVLRDLPTCRILAFKGEHKLHAKVFVFDRSVAVVGTYNMDPMSERINSEDVAVIKSKPFATQNWHRVMRDVEDCIEYRIEVTPDGEVKQLVGPSDHCAAEALETVKRLGKVSFLRGLI